MYITLINDNIITIIQLTQTHKLLQYSYPLHLTHTLTPYSSTPTLNLHPLPLIYILNSLFTLDTSSTTLHPTQPLNLYPSTPSTALPQSYTLCNPSPPGSPRRRHSQLPKWIPRHLPRGLHVNLNPTAKECAQDDGCMHHVCKLSSGYPSVTLNSEIK